MFKKRKEKKRIEKLSDERDKKCVPIAESIIRMIGKYETLGIDIIDQSGMNKAYMRLILEIKKLLLEKNVKLNEINYINQLCIKPLEQVKYALNESLNHSLSEAANYYWGKDQTEITMQDLDKKLKEYEEKRN